MEMGRAAPERMGKLGEGGQGSPKRAEGFLAKEPATAKTAAGEAQAAVVEPAAGGGVSAEDPASPTCISAEIFQHKALLVRKGC